MESLLRSLDAGGQVRVVIRTPGLASVIRVPCVGVRHGLQPGKQASIERILSRLFHDYPYTSRARVVGPAAVLDLPPDNTCRFLVS